MKAFIQEWVESERGWGVRPDGFTLHASLLDRARYIEEYWDSMPDEAPDEYSRPIGEAREVTLTPLGAAKLTAALAGGRCGLHLEDMSTWIAT